MTKVTIDYDKCQNSKQCFEVCPVGVFEKKDGKIVVVRPEDCALCRACEASCPHDAVKVEED